MIEEPSLVRTCGWCQRDVVNPVTQPHMTEVTWYCDLDTFTQHDLICPDCHTEWLRFIARRKRLGRKVA